MKLTEILHAGKPTLSFEVFPPKTTDKLDSVKSATEKIAEARPAFMSVTYGAGGSTGGLTLEIARNIQDTYGVPVLAHLTCVMATPEGLDGQLSRMRSLGLENVMALRGDIPEGSAPVEEWPFRHASDLITYIRSKGDFCIGGACYPEGHPESSSQKEDIRNLKRKVDAGCDFLTTQMFFDNNSLYNFLYKIRETDIRVPVLAGIMPVTNGRQIARICRISGNTLPPRFKQIIDRFGDDHRAMKQAGIAFATEQIIDLLANGVEHIHVYSMNKPEVAGRILDNLSDIL